jgi:putative transcriptional regulator
MAGMYGDHPADKRSEQQYLGGRILIAMPGIDDPRFDRSILLICEHTDEMAMAIALNRPVDGLSLPDVLEKLNVKAAGEAPDEPVLFGGPVERERGRVLHTDDYECPGSTVPVTEGVAMTATREVLDAMGDASLRPRRSFLALGYAGWGPGQLERELQENVWLTCDADETLLFGRDYEAKWGKALAKIGVSASQLSAQSGRA